MKKIVMSAVALTAIMSAPTALSAEDGINILDDLVFDAQIRPRYEMADVKNNDKTTANAYTVRTKLNVRGKLFNVDGLTASVGIISVNNFGSDKYNSTDNGQTQYDIVKDPQKAMISNAEVNYTVDKTTLHAGRGQVNLDNQRFIGTVGWRQFERSYDSIFVANNSVENLSVLAAWVYGLQGVGAADTMNANTALLHAAYKIDDALTVTAYDYMIAADLTPGAGNGGYGFDTYGIALTGKLAMSGVKLNYRAEYAVQDDATMKYQSSATNADNFKANADYYNLDLGANISGILAGVNYEVLSGASTDATSKDTAFNPMLGTNHKFNGWADVFYVAATPQSGLQDLNFRLGYKAKGFGKLLAVYHDFTADTKVYGDINGNPSDDFGSEIDVVYTNKIPGVKNLSGLLKYADYSKGAITEFGGAAHDKQVFWAQLDYKFSTK